MLILIATAVMRQINMLFLDAIHLLALANLLGHVSASPVPSTGNLQSLSPRGTRMCANAPSIAAGR